MIEADNAPYCLIQNQFERFYGKSLTIKHLVLRMLYQVDGVSTNLLHSAILNYYHIYVNKRVFSRYLQELKSCGLIRYSISLCDSRRKLVYLKK